MQYIFKFRSVALVVLLAGFHVSAFSQHGYNLRFKVDGWRDTLVYLTHYYGGTHYISDTALVDRHGSFSFNGRTKLKDRGVYSRTMRTGSEKALLGN